MFRNAYRLPFQLLGIPIQLDLTFLIILPLFAWLIGRDLELFVQAFHLELDTGALTAGLTPYLIGLICALGLFASVLVHELGHSAVGQRYGLQVKSITLWVLGGMAQFERMPQQRGIEAVVAVAGPVTSYLLALLFWLLLGWAPADSPHLNFILFYLQIMNFFLATFNLLPALPLDGGRILRSLLALKMGYLESTQLAARISKILALLLGFAGLVIPNIFLVLIAFFIFMGVTSEAQAATVSELLEGIRVRDLMSREVISVRPEMPVRELIQTMFQRRHLGYPVLDEGGKLVGVVTLRDIKESPFDPVRDTGLRVHDIMSRETPVIHQEAHALEAFQQMHQNDFGRLLVVDDRGHLAGIISKTDLIRALQLRTIGTSLEPGPV